MRVTHTILRKLIREALSHNKQLKHITVGGVPCNVEIANDDMSRSTGLMGREHVPEGTGMLFKYPQPSQLSFWMRNTPSPLSIAFVDKSGKIIKISDMQPFDESSTVSPPDCMAALEVPQGWFRKKGIIPGDHIRLS